MAQKYKAVLTKIGAAKIAAATAGGTKINLTQMAVGDGGGTLPTPDSAQTKLINEKHRAALNKVIVDPKHKNYLVAELVIPPEIGGFWMRELGLYDEVGDLIAVSNMAESYKPMLSEGSGRAQTLRMVVIVSDMDTVNLLIDSSTVLATQEYVDDKLLEHEQSRRHPDATLKEKGFTQLSSATNSTNEALAATPKAVKAAYDLANGKYTAQDATTTQKGIVQLNSATNSTSETLAATPKAVKAAYDKALEADKKAQTADDNAGKANDNANTRLEKNKNLSDLSDKPQARKNLELGTAATSNAQKSATDGTANALMANGAWGLGGLTPVVGTDALTCFYYGAVGAKTNPVNDRGFAFVNLAISGSYRCRLALDYTNAVPRIFYQNILNNTYNPYVEFYTTAKKPTANDVEALPVVGGTMAGAIKVSGTGHGAFSSQNNGEAPLYQYVDTAQTSEYWPIIKQKYKQANSTWSAGMLINSNQFVVHHIDSAGKSASFTFRPDGQFIPQSYANFDAKYQVKGNYTPAGQAYTKAESDSRYIQNTQMGAEEYKDIPYPGQASLPWGACITAIVGTTKPTGGGVGFYISRVYFRRIQKYIGGSWKNIA